MIVVDTNVLAYLFVPGDHTAAAEAVLAVDPEWAAPVLWRSEFRNVLTGLIRRGNLTLRLGQRIAARAESWMQGREFLVATEPVLRLARTSGCSAYDCEYVALATQLGVPLATADAQVLQAFPNVAVHPARFGA